MKRLSIAIVGAGRVGSALAKALAEAGFRTEIVGRRNRLTLAGTGPKAPVRTGSSSARVAKLTADLVWFCVPDSEIAHAAAVHSRQPWQGKIAFHSSGVLSSDALRKLRSAGASVAAVHPLMTFVKRAVPDLRATPFAVEGDAQAVKMASGIVRALGGETFAISKHYKAAYHAFATLICPLFVSLLAASQRVAQRAGLSPHHTRRLMMPILQQTLRNYEALGAASSFSGPIVRGDTATIRLHLAALSRDPAVKRVYSALAEAALENLPSRNRAGILNLISRSVGKRAQAG